VSKKKGCNCAEMVNDELKQFNTKLKRCLSFSMSNMTASAEILIATEKIDSKKRGASKVVTPAYCPFCGVKLP